MSGLEGVILKGIGGFYYVETDEGTFECKARGVHRRNGVTPLAGDNVSITVNRDGYASLDSVLERKNRLSRPPVANVDRLFIVVSTCRPKPSTLVIDKMTAIACSKGIDCVIVFTKVDLADDGGLCGVYETSGFKVIRACAATGEGVDEVRAEINGRVCVFAGNSGVGKSTLINALVPGLGLETGEISLKLGRGRHTTRQVELHKCGGGYLADTPGFAAIEPEGDEFIRKDELAYAFPEFDPFLGQCRFTGCSHVSEPGCRIIEAVDSGEIERSRHDSYVAMYNEAKLVKDWQLPK